MASAAVAPKRSRFAMAPFEFYDSLLSRVDPVSAHLVGLVMRHSNVGCPWQPEWASKTHVFYASVLRIGEDQVGKLLKELVGLEVLRVRKVGHRNEYQAVPENFAKPPERAPKKLVRKPPSVETSTHTVVEMKPVSPDLPDLENGFAEPAAARQSLAPPEGPPEDELEEFCTRTITPKLLSVPPKKEIQQAVKILQGAPVELLKSKIMQRIHVFKSWKMLPLLASDVQKVHRQILKFPASTDQYDLARHWASATEVRRLYSDDKTPQGVKLEIQAMWPELGQPKTTKYPDIPTTPPPRKVNRRAPPLTKEELARYYPGGRLP